MFPDSILKNEKEEILKDISFTNSIYKVYICRMHQAKVLKKGDILVVYRTNDGKGYAEYRACLLYTSLEELEPFRIRFDNTLKFLEGIHEARL